jgi:putative restriction endonuclease
MQTRPSFKLVGNTHGLPHELVHAIVARAEVQLVLVGALLTGLPERQSARENAGGVGGNNCRFSFSTHNSAYTPGQVLGFAQAFSRFADLVLSGNLTGMAKAPAVKWTREHFLIALNLYTKVLFGKLHKGNPKIVDTAGMMGRTPSSLAMKLCNFASLDPVQRARGIRGLSGATKQDKAMWNEFYSNSTALGAESEQLLHDLFTHDDSKEVDFLSSDKVRLVAPSGPTESQSTVKVRRGQQFFRQAVLTAYDVRCCISGINIPRLLVASHIKPWGLFPNDRLNPQNGLCLSTLHDAAFDAGLITLDEKLNVVLSKQLRKFFPQPALEVNFVPFEGARIRLPDKLAEPEASFLSFHRDEIFQR